MGSNAQQTRQRQKGMIEQKIALRTAQLTGRGLDEKKQTKIIGRMRNL